MRTIALSTFLFSGLLAALPCEAAKGVVPARTPKAARTAEDIVRKLWKTPFVVTQPGHAEGRTVYIRELNDAGDKAGVAFSARFKDSDYAWVSLKQMVVKR